MSPRLARMLLRLYPLPWRERYGAEFTAILEDGRGGVRAVADVLWAAVYERIFPVGGMMKEFPWSFRAVSRQPSAFVPMAMSLAALGVVMWHVALGGHGREVDEGTAAHLWQILMAGQVPVVLWFGIRWLRRARRQTMEVLALQAGAVLANFAVVFLLRLG